MPTQQIQIRKKSQRWEKKVGWLRLCSFFSVIKMKFKSPLWWLSACLCSLACAFSHSTIITIFFLQLQRLKMHYHNSLNHCAQIPDSWLEFGNGGWTMEDGDGKSAVAFLASFLTFLPFFLEFGTPTVVDIFVWATIWSKYLILRIPSACSLNSAVEMLIGFSGRRATPARGVEGRKPGQHLGLRTLFSFGGRCCLGGAGALG